MTADKCDVLAAAAAEVLLAVSDDTWARPRSSTHGIPRSRLDALAGALDDAYPGFHERCRQLQRERQASS